jgi:hypothetical protein
MSYTTTTRLGLKKAVAGSNQAFETAIFNENLDKVDAEAVAADARLDSAESRLTSVEGVNTSQGSAISALQTLTASGSVNSANNALKIDSRKLSVASTAPTSPSTGDLWIQV